MPFATMRYRLQHWLTALALLATASAQEPLAVGSNTTYVPNPNHDAQLALDLVGSNLNPFDLVGLTPNASADYMSTRGVSNPLIRGVLTFHNDQNSNISNPAQDIPFISCDDVYRGEIGLDNLLVNAANANVSAVVLFSQQSMQCNTTGTLPGGLVHVFSTTSNVDAGMIFAAVQSGITVIIGSVSTIDQQPNTGSTAGVGGFGGPSTAVAMIILYSITGVITALFLIIIITGAIRAHRHPERYGPRNVIGRPRQSRAKGIARAMLETLPIVKFGDNEQPPKDVELSQSSASNTTPAPIQTKSANVATAEGTATPRDAPSSNLPAAATTLPPPTAGAEDDNKASCSICTEDFEKGQDIRVLPCDHKFHPACVDPWLLDVSGTCPLCRVDLRPAEAPDAADPATATENGDMPPPLDPTADTSNTNSSGGRLRGLLRRLQPANAEERLAALRTFREENASQQRTGASGGAVAAEDHAGRWERVRRRVGL